MSSVSPGSTVFVLDGKSEHLATLVGPCEAGARIRWNFGGKEITVPWSSVQSLDGLSRLRAHPPTKEEPKLPAASTNKKRKKSEDDEDLFDDESSNKDKDASCGQAHREESSDDDSDLFGDKRSDRFTIAMKKNAPEDDDDLFVDESSNKDKDAGCGRAQKEESSDDDSDLFGDASEDDESDGFTMVEYNGEPLTFFKPSPSKVPRKREKPSDLCTFDKPLLIIHQETGKEQYFAKWFFKSRLTILTADLNTLVELEKTREINGCQYDLLVAKLMKNEGKSGKYSRYERKIVKAYYVKRSGKTLQSELERLGDFSSIEEPGKIASRLELMVSTAKHQNDYTLQFKLKTSDFNLVEENFHDGMCMYLCCVVHVVCVLTLCSHLFCISIGCGFAPITFFNDKFGKSAPSIGAIQVRIFGPKIGWYKGMLMKKPGIDRIELPPSMRKVEKSKLKKSPDWVVLVIHANFPSEQCVMMGRAQNPHQKDPTPRWVDNNLKCLDEASMFWHLLLLNGVPEATIQNYSNNSKFWDYRKHCHLVGVADPTNSLPKGTIFLTGLGGVVVDDCHKVITMTTLVTRHPCTEKGDLVILDCVRSKPNCVSLDHWKFLQSLPFGMIVFAAPRDGQTPIAHKIADGDLDGDLFLCLWVGAIPCSIVMIYSVCSQYICPFHFPTQATEIVAYVDHNKDGFLPEVSGDDDPLLYTEFKIDDKPAIVSRKISAKEYEVELEGEETTVTMSRSQILQDRDFVEEIVTHHGRRVQVKWASNLEPTWDTVDHLRNEIESQLAQYAIDHDLTKTLGWGWAARYISDSEMTDIVSHEVTGGNTKVLVVFDDGTKEWRSFEDVKEDAEDLLARYGRKNQLETENGWEWVNKYWRKLGKKWFDRTQDLVAKSQTLRDHDRLTTALHTEYKRACKGGNMESMVAFGRAYKQSIDMRKHGGKVTLPIRLHKNIKEKGLKPYLLADD
jgi:hypothetical protein